MKLYLVKGEHPVVPGRPTKATFDLAEANAFAADLVTKLADDIASAAGEDSYEAATADNWKNVLLWCQARRYMSDRDFLSCSYEDARQAVEALSSDDRGEETGCDVWIEELDVAPPQPIDVAVILEGGLVQHAVARGPGDVRLFVVDYDTEGADEAESSDVPQDDGKVSQAFVREEVPGKAWGDNFWSAVEQGSAA